jgi:hypothetical protein
VQRWYRCAHIERVNLTGCSPRTVNIDYNDEKRSRRHNSDCCQKFQLNRTREFNINIILFQMHQRRWRWRLRRWHQTSLARASFDTRRTDFDRTKWNLPNDDSSKYCGNDESRTADAQNELDWLLFIITITIIIIIIIGNENDNRTIRVDNDDGLVNTRMDGQGV